MAHQRVDYCVKNLLTLTYEHMQFQKKFTLAIARHEGDKQGKEGQRRGRKGREGKGTGRRDFGPHF